jgi:hypothetical protein
VTVSIIVTIYKSITAKNRTPDDVPLVGGGSVGDGGERTSRDVAAIAREWVIQAKYVKQRVYYRSKFTTDHGKASGSEISIPRGSSTTRRPERCHSKDRHR